MSDSMTCGCWPSRGHKCPGHSGYGVGNVDFSPFVPHHVFVTPVPELLDQLWPLIQTLERACWSRKWSDVKKARKVLEDRIGARPNDPSWKAMELEVKSRNSEG